jgi:hypothetical protein
MKTKLFSVCSWNVEHFRSDPARVSRVISFLKGADGGPPDIPDIFALYEVEGRGWKEPSCWLGSRSIRIMR